MSVTYPKGFMAAGISCGLKKDKKDLALVVNTGNKYDASAVFTSNQIKAAPVLWTQEVIKQKKLKAVLVNSGGANACTGAKGFQDTHQSAEILAKKLSIGSAQIGICSTGLIGKRLDIEKIEIGITEAVTKLSETSGSEAAEAILTTDSHAKEVQNDHQNFKIGAMIKGAGMLAPDLATMICIITTDADISKIDHQQVLKYCVSKTLNRLDSDGCTSTNDTVILMSSAASNYEPSTKEFESQLLVVLEKLSNLLIEDAEGSTKVISISVENAKSEEDALEAARAVARNNLLKCAIFGEDPNWGRVLAAVGTAKSEIDQNLIDVTINQQLVCRMGTNLEVEPNIDLSNKHVDITINLNLGKYNAKVLTNDLSIKYVHENSAYST